MKSVETLAEIAFEYSKVSLGPLSAFSAACVQLLFYLQH